MNEILYYSSCGALVLGILIGIAMLSKPETARLGNDISTVCSLFAVLLNMYYFGLMDDIMIWCCIVAGLIIGTVSAIKVRMIEMPQAVALLNGIGGGASMLIAVVSLTDESAVTDKFTIYTGGIALAVGAVTLTGSLIAAGKLAKLIRQKPLILPAHKLITLVTLLITVAGIALIPYVPPVIWIVTVFSLFFGVVFSVRVGGADMPITISLLNSLSGVAGGIAGITVGDPLLASAGGIVGASGLILTQIMCRSMNRKLVDILIPKHSGTSAPDISSDKTPTAAPEKQALTLKPLSEAKKVIIVPGYGMALAQAQSLVKELSDRLEENGAEVKFAIHPVAGRMPGHMNVLLCEVDIPYDKLYEMDDINEEFADCDVVIIIGANDVVNPAANTAEGTPIYGMPVLRAAEAKQIIVCNYDLKPGYAGVENPIYSAGNVRLLLGDAKESLKKLIDETR